MTLIAIGSLHGSPGASTLAVALASRLTAVVAEADPSGGVIAARLGLRREPGMVSLAADRDAAGVDVDRHAQVAPAGVRVLPCPESAEHATALLRSAGDDLAERLDRGTAVVDVGRVGPGTPASPFLERALAFVICCRPTVDQLAIVRARLESLRRARPLLAIIGDRPYDATDVARELGVPVTTVLADDRRGADAVWTGARARSPYARSVSGFSELIGDALHQLEVVA